MIAVYHDYVGSQHDASTLCWHSAVHVHVVPGLCRTCIASYVYLQATRLAIIIIHPSNIYFGNNTVKNFDFMMLMGVLSNVV